MVKGMNKLGLDGLELDLEELVSEAIADLNGSPELRRQFPSIANMMDRVRSEAEKTNLQLKVVKLEARFDEAVAEGDAIAAEWREQCEGLQRANDELRAETVSLGERLADMETKTRALTAAFQDLWVRFSEQVRAQVPALRQRLKAKLERVLPAGFLFVTHWPELEDDCEEARLVAAHQLLLAQQAHSRAIEYWRAATLEAATLEAAMLSCEAFAVNPDGVKVCSEPAVVVCAKCGGVSGAPEPSRKSESPRAEREEKEELLAFDRGGHLLNLLSSLSSRW